jgi:hypothetical protein
MAVLRFSLTAFPRRFSLSVCLSVRLIFAVYFDAAKFLLDVICLPKLKFFVIIFISSFHVRSCYENVICELRLTEGRLNKPGVRKEASKKIEFGSHI